MTTTIGLIGHIGSQTRPSGMPINHGPHANGFCRTHCPPLNAL